MKVILIDPSNKTVTEVEIEKGLQPLYDIIGNGCDMIESPDLDLPHCDICYCDEEGLYHENIGGISNKNWTFPIVGRIVVCAMNSSGDTMDVSSTVEEIKESFDFIDSEDVELIRWFDTFQ